MNTKMTSLEKKASLSIATVLSLRMFGLFMVLPLFSLYAHQLINATPFLIGLALGIYGLAQALLQIPFGWLSDRLGRKKIIAAGLLLFCVGSLVAATAHTIENMIIGRALQGMGAVGSALIALAADLTRQEKRTFAMAIIGVTIGASFTLAMMTGPLLTAWLGMQGLFALAALLGAIGILLLVLWVPTPQHEHWHRDVEPRAEDCWTLLKTPLLLQLNSSIFILHALFTATFIVIPLSLHHALGLSDQTQGWLYLIVLIASFLLSIPLIFLAEKKHRLKPTFTFSIVLLGIAEGLFWLISTKSLWITGVSLLLFLTAFSLLEAFLPSLVSKAAPPKHRGTALGLYSCSQFLGIFVGGTLGGWLYGQLGMTQVYLFCVILTLVWVTMAFKMKIGE